MAAFLEIAAYSANDMFFFNISTWLLNYFFPTSVFGAAISDCDIS